MLSLLSLGAPVTAQTVLKIATLAPEGSSWITALRQIDDDQGLLRPPRHSPAVGAHDFNRHPPRRFQAVNDHGQRIADQQQITIRIEELGHRRRIGSQADERRSTLAGFDPVDADAADMACHLRLILT